MHDALWDFRGDLAELLANPLRTNLYFGFDNLCLDILGQGVSTVGLADQVAAQIAQLGVALGVEPTWTRRAARAMRRAPLRRRGILTRSCARSRRTVRFRCPFPGEPRLVTAMGIASYRPIQAIYQARKLLECCALARKSPHRGRLGNSPAPRRTTRRPHRRINLAPPVGQRTEQDRKPQAPDDALGQECVGVTAPSSSATTKTGLWPEMPGLVKLWQQGSGLGSHLGRLLPQPGAFRGATNLKRTNGIEPCLRLGQDGARLRADPGHLTVSFRRLLDR
ncbi:hypothetical protein [Bradyrhizobium genosp. P]|uniref:hypothetical protein n=1 Tax=Bradyrhizobium genosp. P TaxID=83641 RepID=UPI003CEA5BF2